MLQKTDLFYHQYLPEIKDEIAFREYLNLVEIGLNREKPEGYTEKHHIVPKCYLPKSWTYKDTLINNVVILTAMEHFNAHKYLKDALYDIKMLYAFQRICTLKRDNRIIEITGKEFELVKKQYFEYRKKYFKFSDESKLKLSQSLLGKKKKPFFKEHRLKLSNVHKGKIPYNKGKPASEEQKMKQREQLKNRIWVNNGKQSKLVKQEIADKLLNDGWILGRFVNYELNHRPISKEKLEHIAEVQRNRIRSKEEIEKIKITKRLNRMKKNSYNK